MTLRRVLAVATATMLLALEAGATAYAAEPDPAYPTGSFTLNRTTTYLHRLTGVDLGNTPPVVVTRHDITDDETASEDVAVALFQYAGGDPTYCQEDSCVLPFWGVGTFTPFANLTDEDGHTTTIQLPKVTVLEGHTAAVVTITQPRPRLRHRVSAWRVLRGTAVDPQIGIHDVLVSVVQKRRGRWYYFEGESRTWRRGLRTAAATLRRHSYEMRPATVGTRWQTARIPGLTRGPLAMHAYAYNENLEPSPIKRARARLTRR